MVRASDKGHMPATCVYQVKGGLHSRLVAIGSNAGEAVGEARTSKKHQRNAHLGNLLVVMIVGGGLSQASNDTLYVEANKVIDGQGLVLEVLMTVGTDDAISVATSLILYSIENSRIVVCHQIGHHHTYHLGGLFTQTLCKRIRTVIESLGKILHTLLHLLAYLGRVAQRTADGSYADAKLLCQVFQ